MQSTELDPALAASLSAAGKSNITLVIGDKNYSSWSMRAWLVLAAFDIPFNEILIKLGQPDTTTRIAQYSAAGKVPVLLGDDIAVWDSLAICEFAAEQFPERDLWPRDAAVRAVARSICAEMHAGFKGLRSAMSMDIAGRYPGQGRTLQAQADIGRICEIWENCLAEFGHHRYLFGDFSIADAFFAPVVMRFRSYNVSLAPALRAYVERVTAHPAVARWIAAAEAEAAQRAAQA
ncbi:MAG: glutathione S-transferase [Herbaspirillum sp.]|jgi:glutathione S-transferase|nr:glutathione S-transferase [Herbaspirillum sp.]